MKRILMKVSVVLFLVIFVGCTNIGDKNDLPNESDNPISEIGDGDTEQSGTNEIELGQSEVAKEYFNLSVDQQVAIREKIKTSGVYDEYLSSYDSLVVDFYRNTIGVVAQGKDFPTLLILRYEEPRFDMAPMSYYVQRFYRKEVEFTYEKNDVKKRAILQVSAFINQNNNSHANWYRGMVECSIYVPDSTGQNNFPFYYDFLNDAIYVINDQGENEEMKFTADLQEKILAHSATLTRKFLKIDEKALKLANDIIVFVDEEAR